MTAVEWLEEQISYDNGFNQRCNSFEDFVDLSEFFKKAKEMEKQQLEKVFQEVLKEISKKD